MSKSTRFVLIGTLLLVGGPPCGYMARVADHRGDRARLESRVSLLYHAASEAKWAEVYSFVAAETKRDLPLDLFIEKFQRLQPNRGATVRVAKIELDTPDPNGPPTWQATAEVRMRVRVDHPDGRHETYRGLYDNWVKVSGDWYWVSGSTEGCDRPNYQLKLTAGGGLAAD